MKLKCYKVMVSWLGNPETGNRVYKGGHMVVDLDAVAVGGKPGVRVSTVMKDSVGRNLCEVHDVFQGAMLTGQYWLSRGKIEKARHYLKGAKRPAAQPEGVTTLKGEPPEGAAPPVEDGKNGEELLDPSQPPDDEAEGGGHGDAQEKPTEG